MPEDSQRTLIRCLAKANILSKILVLLDNSTIKTVLSHFVSFRVCTPKGVVRRIMLELFGAAWERYYKEYVNYYFTRIHLRYVTCDTRQRGKVRVATGVWGAMVPLEFPTRSSELDGYVTLMALEMLCALELKCLGGQFSLQVPEPGTGSFISHISFTENGRYLIVVYSFTYREWKKRISSLLDCDEDLPCSEPVGWNWLFSPSEGRRFEILRPNSIQIFDIVPSEPPCVWSICVPCDYLSEQLTCTCSRHKCEAHNCSRGIFNRERDRKLRLVEMHIITAHSNCQNGHGGCPCLTLPSASVRFLIFGNKVFENQQSGIFIIQGMQAIC
jgi:hypothetical protein